MTGSDAAHIAAAILRGDHDTDLWLLAYAVHERGHVLRHQRMPLCAGCGQKTHAAVQHWLADSGEPHAAELMQRQPAAEPSRIW